METLTAQQAKQVIEYFAQQAAEDAPLSGTSWRVWDEHLWMTRMRASLAVERQIKETDWNVLVNHCIDLQSFDRDADAFMYEQGAADWGTSKAQMHNHLEEQVSWEIDNCWNNSGA